MELKNVSQRGVSLIEVLVAMLILGIGVMGYAAVQLNAVKLTEETYSRSQAMAIAQDAIERLRSNVAQIDGYLGSDKWQNVAAWTSCADRASPCGEAGMVNVDITQINHMATTMLPNGKVLIENCPNSTAVCVVVAWGETAAADCDQSQYTNSGSTDEDAHCVEVEFIP